MSIFRFGLLFVMFIRFPFVMAKLRARFSGESMRIDGAVVEYRVSRGKRRAVQGVALGVRLSDKVRFCIQPETNFDKFCKGIGLAEEWQTKDEAFDRDVFIICDDTVLLRALSRNEALRSAVRDLVGNLHGGTLRCSGGCLWIDLASSADKDNSDQMIASEVAGRALPALLRIRGHLEEIVSAGWKAERDTGITRQSVLLILSLGFGVLGAIALLFFHESLSPPRQIVVDSIDDVGMLMAGIAVLAMVMAAFLLLRVSSRLHWVLLDILLVGAPGIYLVAHAVAIDQNQRFDKSIATEQYVDVAGTRVKSGRRGRRTYYVQVERWPDARGETEIKVDRLLYESVDSHSCLRVRWHRGAYGDPWVSEMKPIGRGCPLQPER